MNTLGVITSFLPGHYHSVLLGTLQAHAKAAGASLLLLRTGSQDASYALPVARDAADAWIMLLDSAAPTLLQQMAARGRPVCVIGHDFGCAEFGCVQLDNRAGIVAALTHLYAQGRRNFAYLGTSQIADLVERRQALLDFIATQPDCPSPLLQEATNYSYVAGRAAAQALLAQSKRFDALVCGTDANAQGAILALRESGLRVPQDVAVTGFDNAVYTRNPGDGISTVDQNLETIATLAFADVSARLARPTQAPLRQRVVPRFIARESSGANSVGAGEERVDRDLVRSFLLASSEISYAGTGSRSQYLSGYLARLGPRLRYGCTGRLDGNGQVLLEECFPHPLGHAAEPASLAATDFPPNPAGASQRQAGDLAAVIVENLEHADRELVLVVYKAAEAAGALGSDLLAHEIEVLCHQLEVQNQSEHLAQALSALRNTQEQLLRAEKSSALGIAIAGISHELGTPLGNCRLSTSLLLSSAEHLRQKLAHGALRRSDIESLLDLVLQASGILERNLSSAADLVQNFRRLVGDPIQGECEHFALRQVFDALRTEQSERCAALGVRLELASAAGVELENYPQLLQQCLTELIDNALVHGFDAHAGGHIRISAHSEGNAVSIRVENNGHALDEGARRRIFDPFFTTRMGQASGLGLAMVNNLISGPMGGEIQARNLPQGGVAFDIVLPRYNAQPQGPGGAWAKA